MKSTFSPTRIIIPIADKTIGATTIKCKAELVCMIYNQSIGFVQLDWDIEHFAANPDGSYGDSMKTFIPNVPIQVCTDNTIMVDQATGLPADIANDSITYIGQYDYFKLIAETQPVIVDNLIKQFAPKS